MVLKPVDDRGGVFHFWRAGKAVSDQLTPLLKIGGLAKAHGVILERIPANPEAIHLRPLNAFLQGHAQTTLGALEDLGGLRDGAFELCGGIGLDGDDGDFVNHGLAVKVSD